MNGYVNGMQDGPENGIENIGYRRKVRLKSIRHNNCNKN